MTLKQKMRGVGGEINIVRVLERLGGAAGLRLAERHPLHAYQVAAGSLAEGANSEKQPGHPSGMFTVSSNGTTAGTGILWASMPMAGDAWHATANGALYAYDAADVSKPSLWNSTLDAADDVGTFAKYSPPTVANGKVYLATFSGQLLVYGSSHDRRCCKDGLARGPAAPLGLHDRPGPAPARGRGRRRTWRGRAARCRRRLAAAAALARRGAVDGELRGDRQPAAGWHVTVPLRPRIRSWSAMTAS